MGKPKAIDTVPPTVATASTTPRTIVQAQRPKPPAEASDSKPSIVDPTKAPDGYSVQVAAYNHKAQADQLVSTLRKRGYLARVDGSVAPFRVRIGHYATATEAEDALRKIKAKHMAGFVVRAPER
jgi:DedD protein